MAGIELATAYVNLVPSARGFGQETARQLGADAGASQAASKVGNRLGMALAGAMTGGIALAGKGLFAAVDFDAQMREVFTLLPDITGAAMADMSKQVKGFATDVGVLPTEVVPALYQALSAGVPSGNVFDFLETAQQAAKGGVTDLTTAVDGISSVVNAYGAETVDATKASDLMFTAVRLGKTNFEELSASLFNVTPTASALGVQFGDVTAALATMTAQGVPTSVATTQLRQMLIELSKGGGKTAEMFEQLAGKSFKEFVAEGGSVQDALKLIESGAAFTGQSVSDLFGSTEAGAAALSLTGRNADTFAAALEEMAGASGATSSAFDTMNGGLRPLIDRLKAFGQVALLWIGERAIPAVERIVEIVRRNWPTISEVAGRVRDVFRAVGERIVQVGRWMNENRTVVATFVAVLGGLLIVRTIAAGVMALNAAMAANPAVLLAVAVAALAAGLVWAYENVEWFRAAVDTAGRAAQKAFGWVVDAARSVWEWMRKVWDRTEGFRGFLAAAFTVAVSAVRTQIDLFVGVIRTLYNWAQWVWEKTDVLRRLLAGAFFLAVDVAKGVVNLLWAAIEKVVGWIGTLIDVGGRIVEWFRGAFTSAVNTAKGAVLGLASALGLVDRQFGNIASSARRAGEAIGNAARARVNVPVGARAVGGPVSAGQPYVVGERGRELFVPAADGDVVSHARTMLDSRSGVGARLPDRLVVQIGGRDFDAYLRDRSRAAEAVLS